MVEAAAFLLPGAYRRFPRAIAGVMLQETGHPSIAARKQALDLGDARRHRLEDDVRKISESPLQPPKLGPVFPRPDLLRPLEGRPRLRDQAVHRERDRPQVAARPALLDHDPAHAGRELDEVLEIPLGLSRQADDDVVFQAGGSGAKDHPGLVEDLVVGDPFHDQLAKPVASRFGGNRDASLARRGHSFEERRAQRRDDEARGEHLEAAAPEALRDRLDLRMVEQSGRHQTDATGR